MKDGYPESFCLAPFLGMRQNAYRDLSPCAFGAGEWPLGHLSIPDRFLAAPWESMREKFLSGEKPTECNRCWVEEQAGKTSMRQNYYRRQEATGGLELVQSGKWRNGPKSLTIKLSNVCNLACKTCWGMETNRYKAEGQHYSDVYNEHKNPYMTLRPPAHLSVEEAKGYAEFSANLETVEFFGGEPFLNRTHWVLLEELISKGMSRNIDLYYSTNTTNYPHDDLIALWKHFKQIRFGLSIDGVDQGFHYMRWPGDFNKVAEHVRRFKSELAPHLKDNGTDFLMGGTMTCSSLNVFNVHEVYDWLLEKTGDCYISLVQSPIHLALVNLPEEVKPKVAEKLRKSRHINEFQSLINFMFSAQCNESEWVKFVFWIERQDRYRKLSLSTVFPEFWQILAPHYEKHLKADLSAKSLRETSWAANPANPKPVEHRPLVPMNR